MGRSQIDKWSEEDVDRHMARARSHWQNPDIAELEQRQPIPRPLQIKDRFKNKWERDYASYLEQLRHLRKIVWWGYECWGFRLADKTFIYPDFPIAYPTHFEIHDTKGHRRPQWWAKFKMLKELYPVFRFATVKKEKGRWEVKYI